MENLPSQIPVQIEPDIWEKNTHLKNLLLVLIFVFLASGVVLVSLSVWQSKYRQKIYEETEAGLPVHKTN